LSWAMHRRQTAHGRAMLRQIGVLLLINAAIPFLVPSIAWQAHLGGLIAGFVIGEIWSRLPGSNIEAWRTITGVAVAALAALSVMI
ncbi:MAG: rhomboid family intramembrane serine protease, partial [Actinobacteria bacterium]|nr:rhomboid family intramembrane serine protease [Actinomycetota bacterium]